MPYVNIQVTKGVSHDQRAQIVAEVTDTLVRILGKKPESTHVVIQEIERDHWGVRGRLVADLDAEKVEGNGR